MNWLRFGLVDSKSITFNDITSPRSENDLYDKLKERLKVIHHHNVAQLLVLKEKSTAKHIAVVNSHVSPGYFIYFPTLRLLATITKQTFFFIVVLGVRSTLTELPIANNAGLNYHARTV